MKLSHVAGLLAYSFKKGLIVMFPKQVLCGGSVVFLKYYDKVFPPAYFCLRLLIIFYIIVMDKRHQT